MSTNPERPVGRRVAHRVVDPPYRRKERLADWWAGRQARRAGVTDPTSSPWLMGAEATYREADLRQLAQTTDRLAPVVERVQRTAERLPQLDSEIAQARRDLAVVPEPVLAKMSAGESHLSHADVVSRRGREHAAELGAARRRIAQLREERATVHAQAVADRAVLVEEYELVLEASLRLRWYYTRRVSSYLRSLTGRRGPGLTTAAWELPAAQWATIPSPWMPVGLDELLVTHREEDDVALAA